MTDLKKYSLHTSLVVLSFLIARWIFMDYLYNYSMTFFSRTRANDFIIPLILILIITLFLYLFLQSFFSKRIPRWSAYLFYAIYLPLLVFILFFKSIGIYGIELNPLMFLSDFFSMVVFLNLILFIPLGFLVPLTKKNISSFIIFITLVEISQYVFHLGFFDFGDIVTNTCGFIFGSYLAGTPLGLKFKKMIR